MKNKNTKFRRLKSASYSAAITVFVVAFIVVINMIVSMLPSTYTKFDFTEQGIYTLSEQTKSVAKDLKDDVTIYHVSQNENKDAGIVSVLERYQALSSRIHVVDKDPAVYPKFTAQYTQDTLTDNSLIVTCGERSRVIPCEELYYQEVIEETYDAQTGEYESEQYFNGEDMITSAIDYVTTEDLPKMYVITGHGEQAVGSFTSEIQRENIMVEMLTLAQQKAIPEDTDCILMNAPTTDISKQEADMLTNYLDRGGKFFYISNLSKSATPNLDGVLSRYGIEIEAGFVCEGAGMYYGNYPALIAPVYGSHAIVNPLAEHESVMMLAAPQSIVIREDKPDTIEVTPLLKTSSKAYLKKMDADTDMSALSTVKEEGDKTGVMNVAVVAKRQKMEIVVATTYDLFSAESNESVSNANYDFLLNVTGHLCENDSMVSIRGKQLNSANLTVTSGHMVIWVMVLMVLIPVVCLVTGIIVWARRRGR